ncbi:hypothetical protein NPIL_576251 [Nephila pilipes]|uniref:Uncharacterized protein n=1 Tax=Nephila pilipes TaxID=299642 RepID=A0A8X6P596_NEPPI|nr:hypothetical protein NPIL_576251 [Nephila pilipes]
MPSRSNSFPYHSSVFKLRERRPFPPKRTEFGFEEHNQSSIGTEKSTRTRPWVQPTSHRLNKLNRRNILKTPFIWKIFKSVIFIVCISCFSWQSFNFFQLYFKYPTATHIDLTFPEVLKKPAITFCNNNP